MGDGVASRVHQGIDAGSRGLVVGAADFEVVGGDDMVGSGDVGVEIWFCDIFGEGLPFFLGEGKPLELSRAPNGGIYLVL